VSYGLFVYVILFFSFPMEIALDTMIMLFHVAYSVVYMDTRVSKEGYGVLT
jgi:hypothetical protein